MNTIHACRLEDRSLCSRAAILVVLLLSCLGCTSTPQKLAAKRAAKDMAEKLYAARPELEEARGDDRAPAALSASREGGFHHDVLLALQKRVPGLEWVATGPESDELLELAVEQLDDRFDQKDELEQLGYVHKVEILVRAEARLLEGGEMDIFLHPHDITTHKSLGIAEGNSYGGLERTARWSYFGVRCLAVPFVGIYDIGRTSAAWAFKGEKEPSFFGAIGRGLLAIVYSPVALFRSDYTHTRALFSGGDEAAE